MLSDFAKSYISASVPVLRERSVGINHVFNRHLFKTYPALKPPFNLENNPLGMRQQPLVSILFVYAAHIDNADKLRPIMRRLVYKYTSQGIVDEDFDVIGHYFLSAIKETLGYAATTRLLEAWAEVFDLFVNFMIDEANKLHHEPNISEPETECACAI